MKPKLPANNQTQNETNYNLNDQISYSDIVSKTEVDIPSIFEKINYIPKIDNNIINLPVKKSDDDILNNKEELNKKNKTRYSYDLIEQRSIDMQLDKTKNNNKNIENKEKILKEKNEKVIKYNKIDNFNLINTKKIKINKIMNIKNIKPNLINLKSLNEIINKKTKLCNSIDNNNNKFSNNKKMNKIKHKNNKNNYRKIGLAKIPINGNKTFKEISINLLDLNKINIKNLKELNISRKYLMNKNKNSPITRIKNLKEINKNNLYENDSLLDIKNKKCYSSSNHSFELKDKINSFHFGLNNPKIMDNVFLTGMKSEQRKNSLKNVISIYNRMKKKYNLKNINFYNIPIIKGLNDRQNKNEQKEIENNKQGNKNMKKENDDKENIDINIEIETKENNTNLEEKENDSEFSFISNIKKKEENKKEKNKEKIFKENHKVNEYNEENIFEKLKDMPIKKENDNFNNEENNIINKTKKNNEEKEKEKNIKNDKNYFIRKLIREEHYYIDENGKERILEIKQKFLNDSDNHKNKAPYIKKNIKNIINSSDINEKEKKKIILNLKEHMIPRNKGNIDKEDINIIKIKNYKKLNTLKNKLSLNCDEINKSDKKEKLTEFENEESEQLLNDIFKKLNTDTINKRHSNHEQSKKQSNTDYENTFNASLKRDLFNSKNNNINFQKNLIDMKKDKPIIINSFNYVGNTSRLSSPRNLIIKNITSNNLKEENSSLFNENKFNKLDLKTFNENNSLNYLDNCIKVNKAKKIRILNPDKIININKKNTSGKKNLNKNHHAFHEIKIIKNKLTSNSQSNNNNNKFSLEEPKTSRCLNRIHKLSVELINNSKNDIPYPNNKIIDLNSNFNKQKNFANKSNSDSYFNLHIKNSYRNLMKNNEKSNHMYYESKPIKKNFKDSGYESDGLTGRFSSYSSNFDKDNFNKNKYFYQKWNDNNNRIMTQYNNE